MKTCCGCGKRWADDSRGYNPEKRMCRNLGACVGRSLGPSAAKTYAKLRAGFEHDRPSQREGRSDQ